MKPCPPSTWTASTVTFMAMSLAKHLAIEPSACRKGTLAPAIQAARQTISRAESTAIAISASMKLMPWFLMIGLPNWTRALA